MKKLQVMFYNRMLLMFHYIFLTCLLSMTHDFVRLFLNWKVQSTTLMRPQADMGDNFYTAGQLLSH
jgi:hypothetical protein